MPHPGKVRLCPPRRAQGKRNARVHFTFAFLRSHALPAGRDHTASSLSQHSAEFLEYCKRETCLTLYINLPYNPLAGRRVKLSPRRGIPVCPCRPDSTHCERTTLRTHEWQ